MDPAEVAQNPDLALAKYEYKALQEELQSGDGDGDQDVQRRRLEGVHETIRNVATRLWSPFDSAEMRRSKVIEALHGILRGYNYSVMASWLDQYFLTGDREIFKKLMELGAVWTRFGALPLVQPSHDESTNSTKYVPIDIAKEDSFSIQAAFYRHAMPEMLAQPNAIRTHPDALLAIDASRDAIHFMMALLELEPPLFRYFGNQVFKGVTSRYNILRILQSQAGRVKLQGRKKVSGSIAFAPVCEQSIWVERGCEQVGDLLTWDRAEDALLRSSHMAIARQAELYGGPSASIPIPSDDDIFAMESRWNKLMDVDCLGWWGWKPDFKSNEAKPGVFRAAPEAITSLYTNTPVRESAWPPYIDPIVKSVASKGQFHKDAEASMLRRSARREAEGIPPNPDKKGEEPGPPTEDAAKVWTHGNPGFACNFGVQRDHDGRVDPITTQYRERAWAVPRPPYEGEIMLYIEHVIAPMVRSKVDQSGLLGHEWTMAGTGIFGQRFVDEAKKRLEQSKAGR